jgi:hypothetical protein
MMTSKRPAFATQKRTSTVATRRRRASGSTFDGVSLTQLLPQGSTLGRVESYDIHYGFYRTLRVKAADLDAATDLLVADTVDRRKIGRASLFYVVARTRNRQSIVVLGVSAIVVHAVEE